MWLIKIDSKNGHQFEAYLKETRLHVEIVITILGSLVNTIGEKGGTYMTIQ